MLLTLTLVLYDVRQQDMRWPLTSSSQLQPLTSRLTALRLAAPMVFMESGLINLICSGLSSKRIANQSQLDTLQHVLNGSLLPGRQNNNRGVTKDCQTSRLKYAFNRWPVTTQEEQFPLAFSFKLHKYPDMFERLLSVLWRPHNLYCVHVDSKTPPDVYWRIVNVTSCFPNIVLTQTRISVTYASIWSLYADIECIKVALNSSVKWRYHINVCGQEFPLKTNLEMVQILTALNGTNDVENYPPNLSFINRSYKYKSAIHRGVNLPTNETKAPFPDSAVQIRKGSAYSCLQRRFLDWALRDEVRATSQGNTTGLQHRTTARGNTTGLHHRATQQGYITGQHHRATSQGYSTGQQHRATAQGYSTGQQHKSTQWAVSQGNSSGQHHRATSQGNTTRLHHRATPQGYTTGQHHRATAQGNITGQHNRATSQGNTTGLHHRATSQGNITEQHHRATAQGNSSENTTGLDHRATSQAYSTGQQHRATA